MLGLLEFNPAIDFKLLLAVPLIPLIGYILQIALRGRLAWGDKLLTGGMFVVMCITVYLAAKSIAAAHHGDFLHHSSEAGMEIGWFYSNLEAVPSYLNIVTGILYDPLGALMLAVVGIVSFCVHLFSMGYMHGDKRYHIFFANISLFTFAMLGLVLSDNLLFLFIFWEIMGAMSYLLIGHFSHDPGQPFFFKWAKWASKKAFMTTRIGDVCLLVGLLIFYREFSALWHATPAFQTALPEFHPLRFTHLWEMARLTVEANGGAFPGWMTVGGLFVFGGTIGKSAQIGLHVWLPDAMAGPTPVSAMIHAATMVAAGVFLLGRMFPLMSPEALTVITVIGATTALSAATIGCTSYDIKAVLAWSTISQLGFMVAAVGLGGVVAGMFHMVTHAFFKACLFLSAGSVIHGCHHVQDMRVMGGLRKKMPITFACMLVSTLAIAGFPYFSGFFSKDAILLSAWAGIIDTPFFSGWAIYALLALAIGAALTAFYMFRLICMTFFGEYRGSMESHMYSAQLATEGFEGPAPHHDHHEHAPHESPRTIVVALCILAAFGLPGMAWLLNSWVTHSATLTGMYGATVGEWVQTNVSEAIWDHDSRLGHIAHTRALIVSLIVALGGIALGLYLYVLRRDLPARITAKLGDVYVCIRRRYFVDELVDGYVIPNTVRFAKLQKWFDENVIDGLVNLIGRTNRLVGFFSAWFDKVFIDGAVNAIAAVSQIFGAAFRLLQTGRIQQYAAFAVGGALLTAAWLILS